GSFRYSGTTPYDFEAASFLLKKGAEINFIQKCLSYLEKITKEDLDFIALFKENLNILDIKGKHVGIINLPNLQKSTGELATKLSKFFEIENDLDAVFLITNIDKKRNVIIARSRNEEIDVGYILRQSPFKGGGHSSAASATVSDRTISELETLLREVLFDIYYKETLLVKNFMSSPAKYVNQNVSIEEAIDLFEKYSFSFLPVLDSNGNPIGILTRDLIDKFKQLENLKFAKVGDYCEKEVGVIYEDDTLYKAYLIFSKRNPPLLIVKNRENKVVGVLTKSDLTLYEEEFYKFTITNKKLRNIKQKLESVLRKKTVNNINLLDFIKKIGKLAKDLGLKPYIVGGFVRDLFLDRENFDIDIVVEGDTATVGITDYAQGQLGDITFVEL
ncbi:MAG TPA: CBS domain-containing protein, partial [Aquificae bacterium]|nr:CBS domain-containing protein [Aquificota bacterium]